jgi:hypothetical protein
MLKHYRLWRIACFLLALLLTACAGGVPAPGSTSIPSTSTTVPTAASPQPTLEQTAPSPVDEIDSSALYLFYLHGKIIEDQGLPAISPEFGEYEYEAILDTLRGHGFVVRSEQRAGNSNVLEYAEKIAGQVSDLLDAGVPAENITVVGASKGAGIVFYVSHLLMNSEVNFVPMAICAPGLVAELIRNEVILYGNVLSIYDSVDSYAGSCEELFAFSEGNGLSSHAEIVLDVGTGHGILYQPLDEWVIPAVAFAKDPCAMTSCE